MNTSRTLLLVDTIGQGILMSLIIPGPILSLFWGNDAWVIFSAIGLFFLGTWQFLSNLGWMAYRNDKRRKNYLQIVIGFFLLGALLSLIVPETTAHWVYWLILPFGIAIHYFRISAMVLVGAFNAPRSFWDL